MMAEEQKSKGNVFDCPICLEKLKVPKYFPCLHTFCESCLQTYIESTGVQVRNKNNSSTLSVCCPVCRRTVTHSDAKVTIKTWAKHLPLNHLIISLIETNNKEKGDMPKVCKGCERIQESFPAAFWCQQCAEALCETCKSLHPKIKSFGTHEFIPLDQMTTAKISLPDVEEPCPVHNNKVLEVYCFDHKRSCCSVCFATRHRTCSDVQSIDDVSKCLVSKTGVDSLLGKMSSMIALVEESIKAKRQNVLEIDKQKKDITDHVARELDKLRTVIDRLQSVFLKEMEEIHKEQRNNLVSCEERLEELKKTARNAYELFKNAAEKGNEKQIFLMSENIRLQIASHLQEIKSYLESVKHVYIKFSDNEALPKLSGIQNFGHVETEISDDIICNRDLLSSLKDIKEATILNNMVDPNDHLPLDDPFDLTAKHYSVIECDVSTESSSVIRGGAFLDNGDLVLIDHRNFMMKIFDKSGKFLSVHPFQSKPFDVARSQNPDEFFVTVGDGKNMRVTSWKFTDKASIVGNFRLPSGVTGIHASCSKNELVVGSSSSVYLISSVDGAVQNAAIGGNRSGEVGYVTVSRKSDCFVHIDKSQVVSRDLQMKEKYRYNGILKEPRGLSMDSFDNVYVCDVSPRNNCIFQIKQNGTDGRKFPIQFKTITKPYNIGFHPDGITFFVSDFVKPVVELFKLQCK